MAYYSLAQCYRCVFEASSPEDRMVERVKLVGVPEAIRDFEESLFRSGSDQMRRDVVNWMLETIDHVHKRELVDHELTPYGDLFKRRDLLFDKGPS